MVETTHKETQKQISKTDIATQKQVFVSSVSTQKSTSDDFTVHLQLLDHMGFNDEVISRKLLQKHSGNMRLVVEELMKT